jgi:hypothetical protein
MAGLRDEKARARGGAGVAGARGNFKLVPEASMMT